MSDAILSPTFLFRFSVPFRAAAYPQQIESCQLSEQHTLPSFGELEERPLFAELRGAWSHEGLFFTVRVEGKKQLPWCRSSRLADSDGLHLWIDTRNSQNVHRASRFCHYFVFLPSGGGRGTNEPLACWLEINRARENPRAVPAKELAVAAASRNTGYEMQVAIPATAPTGFDPEEHSQLGFCYAVVDRELGWQTLSIGPEFPLTADPSLWGTLELIGK